MRGPKDPGAPLRSLEEKTHARLATAKHPSLARPRRRAARRAPDACPAVETGTRAAETSPEVDFISSIAAAGRRSRCCHEMTRELGSSLSVEDTCSLSTSKLKSLIPHHATVVFGLEDGKLVPHYASGEGAASHDVSPYPSRRRGLRLGGRTPQAHP